MKYLILLTLPIFISGCVANNLENFKSKVNEIEQKELAALDTASEEAKEVCGKGKGYKDIPRKLAIKYNKCASNIFRKHVLPVTPYSKQFNEFLDEYSVYVSKYSKGKISLEQLMDSQRKALYAYQDKKEAIIRPVMQNMVNQDDTERQQFNGFMKTLASDVGKASDDARQRWKDSMPVNTTCSVYGNTAHCSSW